jgi:hypothetical protein
MSGSFPGHAPSSRGCVGAEITLPVGPSEPLRPHKSAADALDALGRTEEAKALRERYGVTEPEKPRSS